MYKKAVLLGILSTILLSLGGCGYGAIIARDPRWGYEPPYMGVKHAFSSYEKGDPMTPMLLFDLPATFIVDTILLPWDMVTILSRGHKGEQHEKH
jgi:uncharacterized protein YceK